MTEPCRFRRFCLTTTRLSIEFTLPLLAALASLVAVCLILIRHPKSPQSWVFAAGMASICALALLDWTCTRTQSISDVRRLKNIGAVVQSAIPGIWLLFSLMYARSRHGECVRPWVLWLAGLGILPLFVAGFSAAFVGRILPEGSDKIQWWFESTGPSRFLNIVSVVSSIFILMNLESTLRASVGTTRWRVKFVFLGALIIFGTRIYTQSQTLLFSRQSNALAGLEAGGLLLGALLAILGAVRGGFNAMDVYPSRGLLRHSVTFLISGVYLFAVGVLAQVVTYIGGSANFQLQVFLVLLVLAAAAVLLLSDRMRQKVSLAMNRYFGKPLYDFREVWTNFSRRLSTELTQPGLSAAAARSISQTFNVLSVRIWLVDQKKERIAIGASTAPSADETSVAAADFPDFQEFLLFLKGRQRPFDLESCPGRWAEALRHGCGSQFRHGGERLCVPLSARERTLGVVVLGDRVNGSPYSVEELDLLGCIGAQLGSNLLNLRVSEELLQAKELEAFQTMSAFFVHDLKNAVSTLNLMLQNLPLHYDNPEFREDALRGIGKTVDKVNHLIARLSALRKNLELRPADIDLRVVVENALRQLPPIQGIETRLELGDIPTIRGDRELLESVISNLVINAREAVGAEGMVTVQLSGRERRVVLVVSDTGCGMSADFLANSLFRPFHSTKSKGFGIGMFQCKMIVEAHGGSIHVESEVNRGTSFRVILPEKMEAV